MPDIGLRTLGPVLVAPPAGEPPAGEPPVGLPPDGPLPDGPPSGPPSSVGGVVRLPVRLILAGTTTASSAVDEDAPAVDATLVNDLGSKPKLVKTETKALPISKPTTLPSIIVPVISGLIPLYGFK